jgi:hypothetical protein
MRSFLTILVLCLLMGAASARAAETKQPVPPDAISPEDLRVVEVMDILQLMDLTEDMDMLKDINYLIEDDQNETQTH